jgi:hypothetical protein
LLAQCRYKLRPLTATEVSIRGRDEALAVRTATDPTVLASLLDPVPSSYQPQ